MSKRPAIDLSALTSETAAPMQEAVQRAPRLVTPPPSPAPVQEPAQAQPEAKAAPTAEVKSNGTPTANLQALAFKVSPAFRKRFRQRAANSDLKLNELLFAALDAWEEKNGLKS